MRRKNQTHVVVFLTPFLVMACMFSRFIPTPDQTPWIANESGMPPSQVIYADDFNNPPGLWTVSTSATGSLIDYEHGGLRIFVNEANSDFWSRPGQHLSDIRIAVDASKIAGPDDNLYGLICRYQDAGNYYAFVISSDGYYGILRVQGGAYELLGSGVMSFHAIIRQGTSTNRLRADCVGSGLAFSVNGELLLQVQDTTFPEGEIGLIAGSNDLIGVDILFDDLMVYAP